MTNHTRVTAEILNTEGRCVGRETGTWPGNITVPVDPGVYARYRITRVEDGMTLAQVQLVHMASPMPGTVTITAPEEA